MFQHMEDQGLNGIGLSSVLHHTEISGYRPIFKAKPVDGDSTIKIGSHETLRKTQRGDGGRLYLSRVHKYLNVA
jgi:hypothetical protein